MYFVMWIQTFSLDSYIQGFKYWHCVSAYFVTWLFHYRLLLFFNYENEFGF